MKSLLHPAESRFSLFFGLASLGFFLAGIGVLTSIVLSRKDWDAVEVIENSPTISTGLDTENIDKNQRTFAIDVAGAVENPGVFELPVESRVKDALSVAGGLAASADRNWVSRNINLAQKVTDGIKIYIPHLQEVREIPNSTFQIPNSSNSNSVSINAAAASELETLWGVGETRAQAIIDGRPYASIDDLITKKIIPKNVMEKNRTKLSL